MATSIRIKRSSTLGSPATLRAGELAYSSLLGTDANGGDRLYIGTGDETNGAAANIAVIGGKYFTQQITNATSVNTVSTLVKRDTNGDFAARTITAALSGNASTSSKLATARKITVGGTGSDASWEVTFDGSADATSTLILANSGVTANSYGSSTAIPTFTVDAKGRITVAGTVSISTSLTIAGGTGSDTIAIGTDTLTFAGGTGVATTVTNNQVSFAIGQAVSTTSDVTFNSVTVNGTLTSNDITSENISISGNATITGNLTVQGTTTTINSTTIAVGDKNIVLSKDAIDAAGADGAGLTVTGPTTPATLTYTSVDDRWNLNKNLNVTTVYGALSGNASTATKLATARTITATGDAGWEVTFDGSAVVTAALTLATVNTNAGAFGNSTTIPTITVNGKGLVTAVTTNSIPTATSTVLGLASFDATNFTLTSGAVTINTIDGGEYGTP